MIIDKEVEIEIGSTNYTYYKSKGYVVNCGKKIIIKIEDLLVGSVSKINVKCDNCDFVRKIESRHYNNNLLNYGVYYCNKCKHLKSKITKKETYGDENYNNGEKNIKTCLEKYGVEHPLQNENLLKKLKNSKEKKYGDENYNNRLKCSTTKEERYGDKNYNNKEKNEKTCLEKYGENNVFKVKEFKELSFSSRKKRLMKLYENYKLIDVDYIKYEYICECEKGHDFNVPKQIFYNRLVTNTNLCTICNPIYSHSGFESQVIEFLRNNYEGEIIERTRSVINPYELDIYLPELQLALECNGIYWHNELYKSNNYHSMKTDMCEKKGLKLASIYEDDWNFKKDIMKSRILSLLNKNKRILSSDCRIEKIEDVKKIKKFLEENHIKGYVNSSINIGMFHEEELISIMTFCKVRKEKLKNDKYEILRFCNKKYTNIIESENVLLNFFIEIYKPIEIINHVNREYPSNIIFENRFELIKKISPNYHYVINGKRIHRSKFKKIKLVKEGFDENKTEHEIMLNRKIFRIYDNGSLKFVYKF